MLEIKTEKFVDSFKSLLIHFKIINPLHVYVTSIFLCKMNTFYRTKQNLARIMTLFFIFVNSFNVLEDGQILILAPTFNLL